MAFINITTNNLSRELVNTTTYIDNWAYVPGTARTGDHTRVYALQSVDEFKSLFGTSSPEGSITFEYVAGLLNSGIPVLFRRIACTGQDTQSEALGVKKAQTIIKHGEDNHEDLKIVERYGGTFGNDVNISIKNTGNAYYLEVNNKYTLLERKRIAVITSEDDTDVKKNKKLIEGLQNLANELERVTIEVLDTNPETFSLSNEIRYQYLTGGKDFDESLVAAEIPKSYEFIYDKILYQPKFITSGGYTDSNMSTAAPIAEAMKKLTLVRQDCRALIDLPWDTPADEHQTLAQAVAYQQLNNGQAIPSASICAPWQYMQVGTSQQWMPPSYVYLTVVGNSLSKGGTAYTPKAGVANGQIANIIRPQFEIGSDLAEKWQSDDEVNINPIMRLQGGRYVIAGNSTLLLPNGEENNAFIESSIDLTVIEIRRFVYNLSTELQYQYNSQEAFETFALRTSNFLNGMKAEGAVTDFDITNISSNLEPRKLKVKLDVYLSPTIKNIEIFLNVSYGDIEIVTGGES